MINEMIRGNRSCRTFDGVTEIPHETLLTFVDSARLCPSTANKQALKYRIVESRDECDAVLPLTKWAGYFTNIKLPPENHAPTAYIVVCIDNDISGGSPLFLKDVGISSEAISLAAFDAGYASCMIGSFDLTSLKELLNIAENITPSLVIALGVRDEKSELAETADGNIKYFRAPDGTHIVPKRTISEVLL